MPPRTKRYVNDALANKLGVETMPRQGLSTQQLPHTQNRYVDDALANKLGIETMPRQLCPGKDEVVNDYLTHKTDDALTHKPGVSTMASRIKQLKHVSPVFMNK